MKLESLEQFIIAQFKSNTGSIKVPILLHKHIMRLASAFKVASTIEQFVGRCTEVCSSSPHGHKGDRHKSLLTPKRNELRRLFLYIKLMTNTSTGRQEIEQLNCSYPEGPAHLVSSPVGPMYKSKPFYKYTIMKIIAPIVLLVVTFLAGHSLIPLRYKNLCSHR